MDSFEETFVKDFCEESFAEYFSEICVHLKKTNSKYRKKLEEQNSIMNKFDNVVDVLENHCLYPLSKREVKALQRYLSLREDCRAVEEREIFLQGMKEAYFLFKRLQLLK